eukprot:2888730-Amphidinium_carterae.1
MLCAPRPLCCGHHRAVTAVLARLFCKKVNCMNKFTELSNISRERVPLLEKCGVLPTRSTQHAAKHQQHAILYCIRLPHVLPNQETVLTATCLALAAPAALEVAAPRCSRTI